MNLLKFAKVIVFAPLLLTTFLTTTPTVSADEEPEKWSLEKCLQWGLKSNPVMKQTRAAVVSSQARIEGARSSLKPYLSAQASFSRRRQYFSRLQPLGSDAGAIDSISESISVRQVISDSGRTSSRVNSLESSHDASVESEHWQKTVLAADIKTAFMRVLRAVAMVEVQQENLSRFSEHLIRVEAFVEIGTRPPYDITKARLDLSEAQVSLIRTERELADAISNLTRTVGSPTRIKPDITPEALLAMGLAKEIEVSVTPEQLQDRHDIVAGKLQYKSAEYQLINARKGLKPTLSASADHSWSGRDFPLDRSWSLGLSLSIPLWDGGLVRSQVDVARADAEAALARVENIGLNARAEHEMAVTAVKEAAKRFETTKLLVSNASETLELAEGRYEAGLSSPIELTDARVGYASAKGSHVTAFFDFMIAATNLDKSLGRLPAEYKPADEIIPEEQQ